MKYFRSLVVLAASALVATCAQQPAFSQGAVKVPVFTPNQQWTDLGNGPLDVQSVEGNGIIYSSQGSGVGSGTTTTITLTATPAIPPCIGCSIAGGTLVASSIVTAFNGTTTITTNTSQTVAASTPLTWGAACPVNTPGNTPGVAPGGVASLGPPLMLRSGAPSTYPLSTESRICAYGGQQSGFTILTFPIGAH